MARAKNKVSAWLRFFLIGLQDTALRSIHVFKTILVHPGKEYLRILFCNRHSTLQALFGLALDEKLDIANKPLEKINFAELLYKSWWHSSESNYRWEDFFTVRERLNSPELLDHYERTNIRYRYIQGHGEGPGETAVVCVAKYGHGAMITRFTRDILNYNGYKAYKLIIDASELESPKGSKHRVTLFEVNTKKYIMDNGRPHPQGIVKREDYHPLYRNANILYAWEELH